MFSKFVRTSCAVMTLLAVSAANAQVAKRPADAGPAPRRWVPNRRPISLERNLPASDVRSHCATAR